MFMKHNKGRCAIAAYLPFPTLSNYLVCELLSIYVLFLFVEFKTMQFGA